jgi:predicted small integral membrane protein
MAKSSLGRAACILALIGGVLTVVLRLLLFLGFAMVGAYSFGMPRLFPAYEILGLVLGIVAIIISKRATEPMWAVVLIVIGIIDLQGIGALLVLLGGLLGLVSKYV